MLKKILVTFFIGILNIAVIGGKLPNGLRLNTWDNPTKNLQVSSLKEDFEKAREETEFVDDETEKTIRKNQKLFILMGLFFGWMVYKSIGLSKKK